MIRLPHYSEIIILAGMAPLCCLCGIGSIFMITPYFLFLSCGRRWPNFSLLVYVVAEGLARGLPLFLFLLQTSQTIALHVQKEQET